jgi:hypothetical protein
MEVGHNPLFEKCEGGLNKIYKFNHNSLNL